MIRVVVVTALLCLMVLVLCLPLVHTPERFLAQIRYEHQAMEQLWGDVHAQRTLDRAVELQKAAREAMPVLAPTDAPAAGAVDSAVARAIFSANERLSGSSYFRSIDALVLLAAFRLSAMLEWLPWMSAYVAAAIVDGAISRVIKSMEFLHHDPECFALYASAAVVLSCAAVVSMVVPVDMHSMLSPVVLATLALLVGRSIADFHRRG